MSMERYMGYRAAEGRTIQDRELPKVDIAGTEFYVDLNKFEFRQVDDPYNRMTLGDVPDRNGFANFLYDRATKNIYLGTHGISSRLPKTVAQVKVPSLVELDPEGMASLEGRKYEGGTSEPKLLILKCVAPKFYKVRRKGRSI